MTRNTVSLAQQWRSGEETAGLELPLLRTLALDVSVSSLRGLADRVLDLGRVYVRYSEGPERDDRPSIDTESELELPGLSVNPLHAEPWWTRPFEDWLARQICQYQQLQEKNPDRFAWVLQGVEVGRGPDCEPLLRDVRPVAPLDASVLSEAGERYRARFHARRGPEDA